MGGFEGACHINSRGERIDLIAGVQHDLQALNDYRLMLDQGLGVARDAVRWHLIDKGGEYDFSSFVPMLQAASFSGMQVIWNLCHYGWPEEIDIFSPAFVDRFAKFAGACARLVREHDDDVPFYSPMNEISFFAWAAARDCMYPFAHGRDRELKEQLVRATIAAVQMIRDVDPRARFVYPEPSVNCVTPLSRPELEAEARIYDEAQFEAYDMISGRMSDHLGGREEYLDIIGLNYYYSNQWEHAGPRIPWDQEPRDPRWLPFRSLILRAWRRYERPIVITETGHFGAGRARWLKEVTCEVLESRKVGVPVEGICLYPIIDRFDWENRDHWHNSGLWDLLVDQKVYRRVIAPDYAIALADARRLLAQVGCI